MDQATRKLIARLRDYCQDTLDGDTDDESCPGILSALVNTVDTALEGNLELWVDNETQRPYNELRTQDGKEAAILTFLLGHINHK